MRERPILFSGPMVRALLAGTKTQTRRPVKPAPPANTVAMGRWQDPGPEPAYWAFLRDGPVEHDHPFGGAELHGEPWRCPYGQPGDRLWVREAWRAPLAYELTPPRDIPVGTPIVYQADGAGSLPHFNAGRLRPGMFMPRWASRILLEVTEVRVERLQEISEADALAEGIERAGRGWRRYTNNAAEDAARLLPCATSIDSYSSLWEQINGPGSWDANPWVWVVEFRRIDGRP